MNISIDIGGYKTVMYSTLDNGSALSDENGRVAFPTALELSTPLRTFGKGVAGDSVQGIMNRSRAFFFNLTEKKAQEDLYMFLQYLSRTVKVNYASGVLTIPEYFSYFERKILKTLLDESDLKISAFMGHSTAVAACAALRRTDMPEDFMIVDYGYHKTVFSIFSYKENVLTPVQKYVLKKGAIDFDNIICEILIKKYNLKDDEVMRERIFQVVCKIKKILNTLSFVEVSILNHDYSSIKLRLEKDEFMSAVTPLVDEMSAFVKGVFDSSKYEGLIQVVGNNYNSSIIQQIMASYKHLTTLHSSEAAALGSCLGFAVNFRKMKYKINDTISRKISLGVSGEKSIKTIFKENAVIGESICVKYSKANAFSLEVFEDDALIGKIKINKEQTESSENVKVVVATDSFGLFVVNDVFVVRDEVETKIPFEYLPEGLSQERIEEIKSKESLYREKENEYIKTSELRHWMETFVESFDESIDKIFPGLLSSEDKQKIEDYKDRFFDIPSSDWAGEQALKKKMFEELSFVQQKLSAREEEIKSEINSMLEQIEQYISEEDKSVYKLSGKMNFAKLKTALNFQKNKLKLTLEKFTEYEKDWLNKMKQELSCLIEEHEENKRILKERESSAKGGCCGGKPEGGCCRENQENECCREEQEEGCCANEGCCRDENSDEGCCANEGCCNGDMCDE
ncbi:hypothetical protein ENBRE01_1252 [Enteropsectra breve]|nr:hypothetical protein ENBRE01_1252 [Enteropsectra breve]